MKKVIVSLLIFLVAVFCAVVCILGIINGEVNVGLYVVLGASTAVALLLFMKGVFSVFSQVFYFVYSYKLWRLYEDFFETLKVIHAARYKCYLSPNTLREGEEYTSQIEAFGSHILALGDLIITHNMTHGKKLERVHTIMDQTVLLMCRSLPLNEQNVY